MNSMGIQLYPTAEQAALIGKTLSCCKLLWNRMIDDEGKLQKELGRHFLPTPARYKRKLPALKEVDSLALATVHQTLERSFQSHAFNPHDYESPKPAAEWESYTTFCQQTRYGPTIRLEEAGLKLPKIGVVKTGIHEELPPGSTIKSAVVRREDDGFICELCFETAPHAVGAARRLPA